MLQLSGLYCKLPKQAYDICKFNSGNLYLNSIYLEGIWFLPNSWAILVI